ncbi:hypothetical protein ASF25_21095 [Methylobacterium sp. Leaf100]|nr:hypothetical protein ASF25_21095 [Methylobacterium sp. Leaf100]
MELCQGAIVLIDERARDQSLWVPHEIAILSWRRNCDPRFTLVPVLIPPVTPPSLGTSRLEPSALDKLQCLVASDPPAEPELETIVQRAAAGEAPPGYIAAVLARLPSSAEDRSRPQSIENIERLISECLNSVSDNGILAAGQMLGGDLGRWSPNLDRRYALARLLMQADLTRVLDVLRTLMLPKERRRHIVELLSTCWIDFRAADAVRSARDAPAPDRLLAINACEIQVSRMYLCRACGTPSDGCWPTIPLQIGLREDLVEDFIEQIDRQFSEGVPPEERGRYLSWLRMPDPELEPVFVLFPPPEPQKQILDRLRRVYPRLTFLVLTEDRVPMEERMPVSGARFIRPEVDPAQARQVLAWRIGADFYYR